MCTSLTAIFSLPLFCANLFSTTTVSIALVLALLSLWSLYIRGKLWDRRRNILVINHRQTILKQIDEFLQQHPKPNAVLYENILSSSATTLVENMKSKIWLVEDVLLTYCHRAAYLNLSLNCITEIFFEEALQKARYLDKEDSKEGILYGVPISIKDCLNYAGSPSSLGVIKWRKNVMTQNACIIDYLVAAGAIPFCKTNVPQTMMSFECRNPLFGTTENPAVPGFSPGGSSGGEGALIGGGGSILGVGSDVGGSLRIPANFCGIFTLKPSHGSLPGTGSRHFHPSSFLINPVNGPMGKHIEDLALFMHACFGKPDVDVVPRIFSESPTKEKLNIGVIYSLPFLEALPACVRAVEEATESLRDLGHNIMKFEFPIPVLDLVTLMYGVVTSDSGYFYKSGLSGEPIDDVLKPYMRLMSCPRVLIRLLSWVASWHPDPRLQAILNVIGTKDAIEILKMLGKRRDFITAMNRYWIDSQFDCLIMPAFPIPATPHGSFPRVSFAASYTFIWNVLDYVAGVVPVSTVDPRKDTIQHMKGNESFRSKRLLERELERLYDVEKMQGLPVGVQVITPQFKESEALQAMKVLDLALKAKRRK